MLENRVERGQLAIQGLDLSPIKTRLQSKGWTDERVNTAEMWYKRFLLVALKNPGAGLVPNEEIDELWHTHILDMKKYEADTKRIFGRIFYHQPGDGCKDFKPQVERTHALFMKEFGESYFGKNFTCDNPSVTCDNPSATCDNPSFLGKAATCLDVM